MQGRRFCTVTINPASSMVPRSGGAHIGRIRGERMNGNPSLFTMRKPSARFAPRAIRRPRDRCKGVRRARQHAATASARALRRSRGLQAPAAHPPKLMRPARRTCLIGAHRNAIARTFASEQASFPNGRKRGLSQRPFERPCPTPAPWRRQSGKPLSRSPGACWAVSCRPRATAPHPARRQRLEHRAKAEARHRPIARRAFTVASAS